MGSRMANKHTNSLGYMALAAMAAVLAVPDAAHAAYSKTDQPTSYSQGIPGGTILGERSIINNTAAAVQKLNDISKRTEEAEGSDAARQALVDENSDKRQDKLIEENSKRAYERESVDTARRNQKPFTNALPMAITRLGLANLLTQGPTVAHRLVRTMIEDDGASTKAYKGTNDYARDWATLACSSGGISPKMAEAFSSGGVSCSSDARLSGTAMTPSAWQSIDSIAAKPGEKDMNAYKAMVLLGCRNAGNIPRQARLTEPGGFERAMAEAGQGQACREYASCVTTKLRRKFGFDSSTIGTNYETQQAVLQKEGRARCGASGGTYFSQECLHYARFLGRKQNAQDIVEEPNLNAMGANEQVAQLDTANSIEAIGADTDASSCVTPQVRENIVANLNYFTSPEFMVALKDGSFAREVNQQIAELPQVNKRQLVAFNNDMREYMYGVKVQMYAENDPRIQKAPQQMALSDVFDKAGVDMASLMPVTGQKLPAYASLLPSLMEQSRDVTGLLMLAEGNRGANAVAEAELAPFIVQALQGTAAAH